MKQQNNIDEIFKESFKKFEADPGANAWSNIHAGLNSGAAASATTAVASSSSWISSVVIGIVISGVAIGGYFFFNQKGEKKKQQQVKEQKIEQSIKNQQAQENKATLQTSTEFDKTKAAQSETVVTTIKDNQTTASTVKKKPSKKESNQVQFAKEPDTNDNYTKPVIVDIEPIVENSTISAQKINENTKELNDPLVNSEVPEVEEEEVKKKRTSPVITHGKEEELTVESDSNRIDPSEGINIESITPNVSFPNAFSPDGDGINDTFKLLTEQSDEIDNIEVYIFDATMKLINEWNGVNGEWDGTLPDGSLAPSGNYFYKAVVHQRGKQYNEKGFFSLF